MGKISGHMAVMLSCVIFASNILVTDSLTGTWMTSMGYTLTRLVYGTVALWGISLFFPREPVNAKDLGVLAVGGFLGLIVSQMAFAESVQYTSPVNFSLIMAMVPVTVLLLSVVFLKESVSLIKALGIGFSIAGAVLVILQGNVSEAVGANHLLGVIIAVISMASYGGYLVITRQVTQQYSSVTILKWMFLFSVIMLLPFGASELVAQRIYTAEVTHSAIFQLLFVLIFDGTLVYFLLLIALQRLRATTVSTYLNLLPIFTSVIAIFSGQSDLTVVKTIATALVVGGVWLVTRSAEPVKA
ncbi:DMT family transporter [Celerinatantimonas sp. YJH-8]|uniref:DMT family transporter n=1 Tax=Celerinatantimonas sp. YJH-8 TaxID=3228714 RepID=UPI0038C52424